LEHAAPGRAFLGMGIGNSVMAGVGRRPATLREMAEAVDFVRRLTAGEAIDVGGAPVTVRGGGKRIPIMIAGSGPRSLRLAGAIADWVFVTIGSAPDMVGDALGWVRKGAKEAGRDEAEVKTWVFLPGSIALDRAQARAEARPAAVGVATYILRGDAAAKRIPPDVHARYDQFMRRYSYTQHLTPGVSSNFAIAEELGLSDYFIDRCTISGTPEDVRQAMARLREVGVERFCFSFTASPDLGRTLRLFAEQVMPEFRGG
jgi:5,10-methylenetetrahydromethanopterin reductase